MAKVDTEKEAAKVAKVAEKEAAKADRNSATVTWNGGVRTYTRELHGDNFAELAEEFAEKKNGSVA